jgi:hypothetical protein
MQSDRIELHGHVLGLEIGQGHTVAGKQGQFVGVAQTED